VSANGHSPDPPALELIGVHAAYGRIEVVRDVSFVVPWGTVFAILGPNGAGKSTTLRVISGRMTPLRGCVHVAGKHVNGASPAAIARAGVCTIPEGRGIFPNLTVRENLRVATHVGSIGADELEARALDAFPPLQSRREQVAGTLSGGEQQMLALARAVATEPSVLLLDEISLGLAPRIVMDLYEHVARFAEQGISIVIVEQFAHLVTKVCDFAAIMTHGRMVSIGEPGQIVDELKSAYLGARP
jgi:branched-chain amino acid transport system ATP-binding protein